MEKKYAISKLLFVIALIIFFLSAVYSWHNVSYSTASSKMDYVEGFTPIAYKGTAILKNSSSSPSFGFFVPYPIDKSLYSHSPFPGGSIGVRAECMSGIWYMYLAIFAILIIYGIIFSIIKNHLLHFALATVIAFLIIASLIVFFLFYPEALNYDIHSNYPDLGNIGLDDQYASNDTVIVSSLGFGFIFAVVSMILFLVSGIVAYLSTPSKVEKVEKKPVEKKVVKEERPVSKKEVPPPPKKKEEKKVEERREEGKEEEKKKEEVKGKRIKVQCPNCGNFFEVEIIELPMTIQCPHCGAEGEIG